MIIDDDFGQFGPRRKRSLREAWHFRKRDSWAGISGLPSIGSDQGQACESDRFSDERVVTVGITAGQAVDALPQQVMDGVFNHVGIALVEDARRKNARSGAIRESMP